MTRHVDPAALGALAAEGGGVPEDRVPAVNAVDQALPRIGTRRRLVLLFAAFTAAIEALGNLDLVPKVPIGQLDLPLSVIPAFGLAVVCGSRLAGRASHRRWALAYWGTMALLLPALAVAFYRNGELDLWLSLMVAAASEELIYRLAIPAVFAAVLRAGHVGPDRARLAGLILAGIWFVVLPGHVEQMDTVANVLPYLAFATLTALMVYRSGSILPLAASHAVSNLITFLLWDDAVAADQRGTILACVLTLLVIAYGRPRRLALNDDGGLIDVRTGLDVAELDLAEETVTTVILVDGQEVVVEDRPAPAYHRTTVTRTAMASTPEDP